MIVLQVMMFSLPTILHNKIKRWNCQWLMDVIGAMTGGWATFMRGGWVWVVSDFVVQSWVDRLVYLGLL